MALALAFGTTRGPASTLPISDLTMANMLDIIRTYDGLHTGVLTSHDPDHPARSSRTPLTLHAPAPTLLYGVTNTTILLSFLSLKITACVDTFAFSCHIVYNYT